MFIEQGEKILVTTADGRSIHQEPKGSFFLEK